jgi:D-glycero-alpha-D-manno-heptose-7-phosphate kinase
LHAAFGGINTFTFQNKAWTRTPVDMNEDNFRKLSDSLYIVYTGMLRSANMIEKSKEKSRNTETLLSEIYHLALEGEKALRQNSISLEKIGSLMIEGWTLKSRLSNLVTSTEIDTVYLKIMSEGAFGAKLCGAGGGGFFLVLAETAVAKKIGDKLGRDKIMKVDVYNSGVKIGNL